MGVSNQLTRWLTSSVLVPAGTAPAAPVGVFVQPGYADLLMVRVQFDPSINNTCGVQFTYANGFICPSPSVFGFIVGDNQTLEYGIGLRVWQRLGARLYNLDAVDHTIPISWQLADVHNRNAAPTMNAVH